MPKGLSMPATRQATPYDSSRPDPIMTGLNLLSMARTRVLTLAEQRVSLFYPSSLSIPLFTP